MPGGARTWVRWSFRDLRARWALVATVAAVIAVGTGLATGLGSLETWRTRSNDASFAALAVHDVRVTLADGAFAPRGRLAAAARAARPGAVTAERLVVPTNVEAPGRDGAVLVAGALVGVPAADAPAGVDRMWISAGRGLRASDRGRPVVVLEAGFADVAGVPVGADITLAGGATARVVGLGRLPEHLYVVSPGVGFRSDDAYTVVYASLETAAALAGRPGRVNEVVARLPGGAGDATAAGAAVLRRLSPARSAGAAGTVTALRDEPAHRLLYVDARNDQRLMDVFSLLVLAAATLGAFTLMTRVVEAQRREIGIGMALGVPAPTLAVRPLLMGAQVAVAGAALGVAAGFLMRSLLEGLLRDLLPLPVLLTPFEIGIFLRGAAIGVAAPVVAAVYPVVRAVRVTPVEAVALTPRSAAAGLAPALRSLRVPGGALAQMAARGVLRAPRRTVVSSLGMAAVIAVVIGLGGTVDSFTATIDRVARETAGATPRRVEAGLDGFRPAAAAAAAVAALDEVGAAEPLLRLPARVAGPRGDIGAQIEVIDGASRVWRPTVASGAFPAGDGVLLAEKAARDLGVAAGGRVVLGVPRRDGDRVVVAAVSVTVAGTHPSPFRFLVYAGPGLARRLGFAGAANALRIVPAAGTKLEDVIRVAVRQEGVATAQRASALTDSVKRRLDDFDGILRFTEVVMLLLAVLMAVNTSRIAGEERRREHATLMAFGVPVRGVLAVGMAESLVLGVVATALGAAGGTVIVRWVMGGLMAETLPDIGAVVAVGGGTWGTAVAVGVLAVGAAPLLTRRAVRRLDVPSALRVVE